MGLNGFSRLKFEIGMPIANEIVAFIYSIALVDLAARSKYWGA
jgi:hypothetical protein